MPKAIDKMTIDELRAYARDLEARLAVYEQPDYVYFLHNPDANVVKIGHSRQVKKRMATLARQTKRELMLLGVVQGDKYLKRKLQKQFKALLTDDDEWFRLEGALATYIQENTTSLPE